MPRSERSSAEPAAGSRQATDELAALDIGKVVAPDINGVVADANSVGLKYVVIGGFSVIANGYVRATDDSDLLVPDGPQADEAVLRFLERVDATRLHDDKRLTGDDVVAAPHIRVNTRHGLVDIMRGGLPPLDYHTVAAHAMTVDVGGQPALVASLRSLVALKRLANRPGDRRDLEELEALNGPLPIEPIPGLDR